MADNRLEGTRDDPIVCTQTCYRRCYHTFLAPHPAKGQHYHVAAYLDLGGLCPSCREKRAQAKAARDKGAQHA